jgi:hypothetical protein
MIKTLVRDKTDELKKMYAKPLTNDSSMTHRS